MQGAAGRDWNRNVEYFGKNRAKNLLHLKIRGVLLNLTTIVVCNPVFMRDD